VVDREKENWYSLFIKSASFIFSENQLKAPDLWGFQLIYAFDFVLLRFF